MASKKNDICILAQRKNKKYRKDKISKNIDRRNKNI